MSKSPKLTDADLKELVFKKNPRVNYKVEGKQVTIIRAQNHWIQKFLRKLHFKIPEFTYLDLDEYGSFVFQQIDGQRSAYEIGQNLGEQFEEANDYLYSRLLLYLKQLEVNEQIIERV